MEATKNIDTIDAYIASFPKAVQTKLQQLRRTIQKAAPDATEAISYQMPTFKLEGNLVHFAAYKHHIGFYPAPRALEAFQQELAAYKGSKGAVQFPIEESLPLDLITRMVLHRVKENLAKADIKKPRKKPEAPAAPFSDLSAPAQRALQNHGITTLKQLAKHSEAEILSLHGMGPASIPKLKAAMAAAGLSFK